MTINMSHREKQNLTQTNEKRHLASNIDEKDDVSLAASEDKSQFSNIHDRWDGLDPQI